MNYLQWLTKAEDDLRIAKLLYENNEKPWAIIFHAEQSIEKMLKAFLVFNNTDFKKIHDLYYLIKLCSEIDSNFGKLLDLNLEIINEAISMRYPYNNELSLENAEEAIKIAEQVRDFVMSKLEKEKK